MRRGFGVQKVAFELGLLLENIESKKGQDKKMLPESESDKTRFWGPAEQAAFAGSAA